MRFITALFILLSFTACDNANDTTNTIIKIDSSVTKTDVISAPGDIINVSKKDTILAIPPMYIERLALVAFAKTFLGTPYVYGSKDPDVGFDCSGFIYYVFTHFNIDVPRSSVEFTSLGEDVNIKNARPGDLILFTGTDSNIRIVGHMGIVIENTDTLKFIQASSGRAYSVVITPLDNYYQGRLMKIISMLPDYSTSVLPTDSAKTLGKTSLIFK
ncbi:MAG: C40 family peptidase [Ferruginibacter sp.]